MSNSSLTQCFNGTVKLKSLVKVLLGLGLLTACLANQNCLCQGEFGDRKFTRAELLMVNMAHGKGSAGFYILEAQREVKEATRNLERAMSQVQQVQATYGKSKGRPDDKFLPTTELKLVQARQHSQELEVLTSETFQELKRSIKDALLKN